MDKIPERITSFSVDHDFITEGVYISRIDGDITTFDMRTRIPNRGVYMDNLTMHSFEHMFATFVRSSEIGKNVVYFGPMGCQTGFYLLVRNADNDVVLDTVKTVLEKIVNHEGDVFGKSAIECGHYENLDITLAKNEAKRYLDVLNNKVNDFIYP